ncbi:ABC transporter ATP-binding protein [Pelagovum pacificum]|uniref:ABC transporter ATP-binding protein n=1 Tax=Pelagovum pacificum TaxID=2588711 RepID=A0A5C5GEK3_9RHOB|nr:ABC transporter ATP-binding protein [Pelagovum pacificum]QQA44254.1 ABC transporter ATP-binding protein [Pelagovum pacificum]TNY32624.1 ABC transporter ATP-binding protein [Pelagovum pacificum]
MTSDPVLAVRNLTTRFDTERGAFRAVSDVSLEIHRGETLAVVGESGSGKSVTSLSVMGLLPTPPATIESGAITFTGGDGRTRDLLTIPKEELRALRGNDIAMIFQEPMTSLNPVFRVGDQIAEAIMLHQKKSRRDAMRAAVEMLRIVGISGPESRVKNFPHQMSGGMRQRVMIALALSCRPSLLIADEPTTALDVTIQSQILRLIADLRTEMDTAVMFITHDLAVVAEIADRVCIMYCGRVVEEGPVREVFTTPRHPYTRALLASRPGAIARKRGEPKQRLYAIPGKVPSPLDPPPGCAFAPRCPHATAACDSAMPPLEAAGTGRAVRCIRWKEVS